MKILSLFITLGLFVSCQVTSDPKEMQDLQTDEQIVLHYNKLAKLMVKHDLHPKFLEVSVKDYELAPRTADGSIDYVAMEEALIAHRDEIAAMFRQSDSSEQLFFTQKIDDVFPEELLEKMRTTGFTSADDYDKWAAKYPNHLVPRETDEADF